MQILDGKQLAQEILDGVKEKIAASKKQIRLAVVVVGDDPVVKKFIEQKKKAAESVGIDVRVYPFAAEESLTTKKLREALFDIVHEEKNSGVIVQLPLPSHIDRQAVLNAVTPDKDPDTLSARSLGSIMVGKQKLLPPVAGAVKALLEQYQIEYRQNKRIVILGQGDLVGRPVAMWLLREKIGYEIINSKTPDVEESLRRADIIISGIGRPKFLTADTVKEGVVIIDAGTSESQGKVVGDADAESLSQKASHLTPVPGGVGPVTVAVLLENLVELTLSHKK